MNDSRLVVRGSSIERKALVGMLPLAEGENFNKWETELLYNDKTLSKFNTSDANSAELYAREYVNGGDLHSSLLALIAEWENE